MSFLMIENPGICPTGAFTLIGATTKRGNTNIATIGRFGSGCNNSLAVCLRHGIPPIVYCSNLKLEFGTRTEHMNNHRFDRVQVKYGGKDENGVNKSATEDLGFVIEYGAEDWLDAALAIREFISNALDQAYEYEDQQFIQNFRKKAGWSDDFTNNFEIEKLGKQELEHYRRSSVYRPWELVKIEIVPDNKVRAKSGFTRVFVPINEAVEKFYENLHKWFLHFHEPDCLSKSLLPKSDRNLSADQSAVIYRRGVRVREFSVGDSSLFDYNLNDLKLDESRQADDWAVRSAATQALLDAGPDALVHFLMSCNKEETYWEHEFDSYIINQSVSESKQKLRKAAWSAAIKRAVPDYEIICGLGSSDLAERKGLKPFVVPINFLDIIQKCGSGRTLMEVCTQDELSGREYVLPSDAHVQTLNLVWDKLSGLNLTCGKPKPQLKVYKQVMDGGTTIFGFCAGDTVYLNERLSKDKQGVKVCLEEVVHYLTKSGDFSRDLQDFAFLLAAELMLGQ